MITVSKEILLHPDFTENLADKLCEMLEALMDEAFESDEIDFDFIDECADAVNAIRSGDTAQILPIISRKDFLKKLNIKTGNKFRIATIAAAVAALIFIAGTQIEVYENVSFIRALSGFVSEFFEREKKFENETTNAKTTHISSEKTTESKETTTEQITEKLTFVTRISVETTPEFKKEYYVGEKFSDKGIKVFAEYLNGERMLVQVDNYTVDISENFGKLPQYETVVIRANGFTEELTVRVVENLSTKKLNSIYAVFPDSFDFTAENLDNFNCDTMQVFALYSDGSEKELQKGEYVVSYEHSKTLFNEKLTVTVEYENCSCSFAVSKK